MKLKKIIMSRTNILKDAETFKSLIVDNPQHNYDKEVVVTTVSKCIQICFN